MKLLFGSLCCRPLQGEILCMIFFLWVKKKNGNETCIFFFRFLMSLELEGKANTFLDLLTSCAQLGSSFFYTQRPFSIFTRHQEVSKVADYSYNYSCCNSTVLQSRNFGRDINRRRTLISFCQKHLEEFAFFDGA